MNKILALFLLSLSLSVPSYAMKRDIGQIQDPVTQGKEKRAKSLEERNQIQAQDFGVSSLEDLIEQSQDAFSVIALHCDGETFSALTQVCKRIQEICDSIPVACLYKIAFLDTAVFGNENLFTRFIRQGAYKTKYPNNWPVEFACISQKDDEGDCKRAAKVCMRGGDKIWYKTSNADFYDSAELPEYQKIFNAIISTVGLAAKCLKFSFGKLLHVYLIANAQDNCLFWLLYFKKPNGLSAWIMQGAFDQNESSLENAKLLFFFINEDMSDEFNERFFTEQYWKTMVAVLRQHENHNSSKILLRSWTMCTENQMLVMNARTLTSSDDSFAPFAINIAYTLALQSNNHAMLQVLRENCETKAHIYTEFA